MFFEGKSLTFSNKTGHNNLELLNLIEEEILDHSNTLVKLNIPLYDGKAISIVEGKGVIKAKIYSQEYIYYQTYIPNTLLNTIKKYIVA